MINTDFKNLFNDEILRASNAVNAAIENYLREYFGDYETAEALARFFVLEIEHVEPDYDIHGYHNFEKDIVYRFEVKYRLRRLSPDELKQQAVEGTLLEEMRKLEQKKRGK